MKSTNPFMFKVIVTTHVDDGQDVITWRELANQSIITWTELANQSITESTIPPYSLDLNLHNKTEYNTMYIDIQCFIEDQEVKVWKRSNDWFLLISSHYNDTKFHFVW